MQMEILKNDSSVANKKEVGTRNKKDRSKTNLQVVEIVMGNFNRLVPVHIQEKPPSYLIIGGLVFTCCTVPYLKSEYGKDFDYDSPVRILYNMFNGNADDQSEQMIVLSQVLVSDIAVGYEEFINMQLISFNGTKIKNLRQLSDLISNCKDGFLRFDLEKNGVVILKTEKAILATNEVLKTHCIARDRSDDLIIDSNGCGDNV